MKTKAWLKAWLVASALFAGTACEWLTAEGSNPPGTESEGQAPVQCQLSADCLGSSSTSCTSIDCGTPVKGADSSMGSDVWNQYNCASSGAAFWSGPEQIHAFCAQQDGQVLARLEPHQQDVDLDLMILNDQADNQSCGFTGDTSYLSVERGRCYYFVVDGYLGASGAYDLGLECEGEQHPQEPSILCGAERTSLDDQAERIAQGIVMEVNAYAQKQTVRLEEDWCGPGNECFDYAAMVEYNHGPGPAAIISLDRQHCKMLLAAKRILADSIDTVFDQEGIYDQYIRYAVHEDLDSWHIWPFLSAGESFVPASPQSTSLVPGAKIILANQGELALTHTDDVAPVLGTFGLATCRGVLIYEQTHGIAAVAHIDSEEDAVALHYILKEVSQVFGIDVLQEVNSTLVYLTDNFNPVAREAIELHLGMTVEVLPRHFLFDTRNGMFVEDFRPHELEFHNREELRRRDTLTAAIRKKFDIPFIQRVYP